jgi:hypothetical protein
MGETPITGNWNRDLQLQVCRNGIIMSFIKSLFSESECVIVHPYVIDIGVYLHSARLSRSWQGRFETNSLLTSNITEGV